MAKISSPNSSTKTMMSYTLVCMSPGYVVTVGGVIQGWLWERSPGADTRGPLRKSTSALSTCVLQERNQPEAACRPWFRGGIPSGTLLLADLKRQSSLESCHGDQIPISHTSPNAFYVPEQNLRYGVIVCYTLSEKEKLCINILQLYWTWTCGLKQSWFKSVMRWEGLVSL